MQRGTRLLTLLVVLVALSAPDGAAKELNVATFWGSAGLVFHGIRAAADRFQEMNPDLVINLIPTNDEQLRVQMAAGTPPDVYVGVNSYSMFSYAKEGIVQPLDDLIARVGGLGEASYIPGAWSLATVEGRVYGLPLHVVGPVFFWNQDHFAESGLNATEPPPFSQLDEYHRRLTRIDGAGNLEQVGLLPHIHYFEGNAVSNWGRSFLWESAWDDASSSYRLFDARLLEAAEWLQQYAAEFPPAVVGTAFGGGNFPNWFSNGKLSMVSGPPVLGAQVAMSANPFPAGAHFHPSADGNNRTAIEVWQGSLIAGGNEADLGFDFLRFLSADPVGTELFWQASGQIPSVLGSNAWDEIRANELQRGAADVLATSMSIGPIGPFDYRRAVLDEAMKQVYEGAPAAGVLTDAERMLNARVIEWMAHVDSPNR